MRSLPTLILFLLINVSRTSSFSLVDIPDVIHHIHTASASAAGESDSILSHSIIPHYVKHASIALPHAKTAAAAALQHGSAGLLKHHHHHHHPFDPLTSYRNLLQVHPLPTKMMTGATLAVCGDAIAQSKDRDVEYDHRRAASFAVFDMAYRALQHFTFPIIVAACHGQLLGSVPGIGTTTTMWDVSQLAAMERTLASQLGIVPLLYYPAFFALTGSIQGLTTEAAVTRARENFIPLMKRNLLFWIPVQFVQFGYVPQDLQIPFLSVCGLAWTFILSVAAGSTKGYSAAPSPPISGEYNKDDDVRIISPATTMITTMNKVSNNAHEVADSSLVPVVTGEAELLVNAAVLVDQTTSQSTKRQDTVRAKSYGPPSRPSMVITMADVPAH